MAETGVSSSKSPETNQVDIDDLLDQDEQDLRNSSKKDRVVESGDNEPGNTGEEESENDSDNTDEDSEEAVAEEKARNFYHAMTEDDPSDEAPPPSPLPSPNPYAHPQILDSELDFD